MLLCGYYTDEALVEDFAAEPAIPLIPGEDEQVDYGATLLFGLYMYERLGADFVAGLFADAADGRTSIEDALYELGNDPTFERLFLDWSVANLIDAESDPWAELYGYAMIDTPEFARLQRVEQLPAGVDLQLNGWSANYIDVEVTGLSGLRARVVSGKASDLGLALISFDGSAQDPPERVLASEGDELTIGVPAGGDEISVVVTLPENAPADAGYVLELEEAEAPADDDDDDGGDDDDDDDGGCCG